MRFYLRTISYFRKDWSLVALLLSLIGISILIGLLQAWPMAILVDAVLTPTPHYGWVHRLVLTPVPHNIVAQVIAVALFGMFLKIAQDALTLIKNAINRRIDFNSIIRVRSTLFRKLQSLGPEYHKNQPQGDAIYRVTTDASGFKDVLNTLITTVVAGITLTVMAAIMFSRNVPLTFFALSIFPVLIIINKFYGPRIKRASIKSKEQETDYTTVLQRSMSVISLVQAFARETREFGRFKAANLRCSSGWMRQVLETETYWFLVRTVFSLAGAIFFGYGGYIIYRDQFVLHKPNGMTVGDLMILMAYLGGLWGPLSDLTSFSANIQAAVAAVERVYTVLDREPRVINPIQPLRLPRRLRELELENIGFGYRDEQHVLRGINATIPAGQLVAFVGPSGAGKSTLLNLLNRFYDPTHGSVCIDGHDLRDLYLPDVRRNIALVPQDSQVFAGTIAQNISFGKTDATMQAIMHAAHLAGADDFIRELPSGYETVIAEGGQNLSGGQRQRLAVARAILSKAPILVLDEPTSALDPQHTQHIIKTLHHLRGERTIILVTHHLASVAGCDEIFVLDGGEIVERGTHEELIEQDGLYATMLRAEPKEDQQRITEAA